MSGIIALMRPCLPALLCCLLLTFGTVFAQSDALELVKQGRKLNNEGKQDEALALYRQALQVSPELFDAHLAAGIALDLKGHYVEARRHLLKAIELAKPEAKVSTMRTMAVSYAFERKAKEAARFEGPVFEDQVKAANFTAAAETANELARIFIESGDLAEAEAWYRKGHENGLKKADLPAAEKDLWDFRWEHAQARIAIRRKHRTDADRHVADAKAILDKGTNPDQARFFPYLTGYVAFYAGEYKTAVAELAKADQRDPFILSLIAQAYEKIGDAAQAKEYYRKVLTSNAHNPTNAFARPLARKKVG